MKINAALLQAICPALGARAVEWVEPINAALDAAQCNTIDRAGMFLAQARHESAQFTRLEESLNYSAAGLLATFPTRFTPAEARAYERQPQRIACKAYAGRMGNGNEESGDGWRYRGRGLFQVTGRDNYHEVGVALLSSGDALLQDPDLLLRPEFAALSAAWYWASNGLNALADIADFDGVSDVINKGRKTAAVGDSNGYADRLAGWKLCLDVLIPTA